MHLLSLNMVVLSETKRVKWKQVSFPLCVLSAPPYARLGAPSKGVTNRGVAVPWTDDHSDISSISSDLKRIIY